MSTTTPTAPANLNEECPITAFDVPPAAPFSVEITGNLAAALSAIADQHDMSVEDYTRAALVSSCAFLSDEGSECSLNQEDYPEITAWLKN
jgi:hypothetical protein